MRRLPHVIGACASAILFVSCAALKDEDGGSGLASHDNFPKLTDTPLARLLPAGGLKIVEAREEDLQEMPSGHDRALAYRKERRSGFWFFGGPIHFEEPALPDIGGELDGSLLPPRLP